MIGVVENRMLERLREATKAGVLPYGYRMLATWPKLFDEFLESNVVTYPAAWATFAGVHSIERVARGRWRAHAAFGLVVAAENVRNEEARRHGGTAAEPGSYQLAIDALRVLGDQTLGLDIDALTPTSVLHVETADLPKLRQVSIYAVTFDTGLYYDTEPCAELADFKTLHINWDPAPYGHVDADAETPGVQIPDDAHAIATDSIALQED